MIRSLYSGVSGLTTHQVRMDVIGNNIANVNSHGYKSHRATFRDIYYQTAISPTSGKAAYAGNNPSEVGYGVQLGSIDKDMSQSSGQGTNSDYDMMIEGDGFFMIATYDGININSNLKSREITFTRLGNFQVDGYGNLASATNCFVVGSRNSLAGLRSTGTYSENYLNDVEVKDRNGDGTINSSDITFRNTINLNELCQTAYNVFTDEFGYMYGYDWEAIIEAATGEDADNALADIVVWDFDGTDEAFDALTVDEKMQYLDVQQTLMNLNEPTTTPGENGGAATTTIPGLNYRYYVDKTGQRLDITPPGEEGGAGGDNAATPYATVYGLLQTANATAGIEARETAMKLAKAQANTAGALMGELTYSDMNSFKVGKDGALYVTYNSDTKYLARIEIAVFDNPFGLDEVGNTSYAVSSASGDARIRKPGQEGAGEIKNKYLEMSNVNLANEFSDMIVTQRGYQANARMITTSDSMLEELVNLKR
ncbi:MAG: flagellar hook-basal body complex protein [Oscillospiraceae bacterium]|nr:flagellar hook-basal body complex protein [Oscillospiraceae bacterium]